MRLGFGALLLLGIISASLLPACAQYILWQYPTFDVQLPPAVASDGTVYVVSQSGSLEAVSPSGLRKWSVPLGAAPTTSPLADSSGFIYVGLADGSLVSFAPDGSRRWSLPLGGEVIPPMVLGTQNRIYAASGDGVAHCVSADGKRLWSYNSNAKITGPPVPDGAGLVYLATDAYGFIALDDSDGTEKWIFPNVAGNGYRPWPTQAGIWFGDDTGFIYLLSRDGKDLLTIGPTVNGGKWICARIAAAQDGTLYAPAGDGKLHAVGADGNDIWSVSLPEGASSTPFLASDGLVYVGSGSKVVAIAPGGEIRLEFSGKGTAASVLRHESGALFASFSRGGL
ncbi:MAG: outer membrane protein assembly factor BamB family protein, partial [Armatimonadota bacterium]